MAGTAACNAHTPAWIDDLATGSPVDIPYDPSGVAPGAMLGNFNVFPGTAGSARAEDILNGLQDAFEQGFDVANMSLGGGSNGAQDIYTEAIERFDRAGMVVAVAAGNSGPGDETVESPGFASRALDGWRQQRRPLRGLTRPDSRRRAVRSSGRRLRDG